MFYGWWLVLVGLITQGLGAGGVLYAYSVLVLPLEYEFQGTRMAMMWGLTCSHLVSGLASPWPGSLADRRPMRGLTAAGMPLMSPVITPPVLLSPLLAGRVFDVTGTYHLVFEIFVAAVLLAATPLVRLQPMGRHAS